MDKESKIKILNYLYPTETIRDFMFNDLIVELDKILNKDICFCNENIEQSNRFMNNLELKKSIKEFLDSNNNYKKVLKKFFGNRDETLIIDDIALGYVFYVALTTYKGKINIFKDKRSICYCPISLLDVI